MNKEKNDDILGTFLLANIPEIITQEEFDDVKSAIKDLQKKAELGEHYKHLYSEVKKQKDDIVKYVNSIVFEESFTFVRERAEVKYNLLRMLGDSDDK